MKISKPTKREVFILNGIEVSREVANNAAYKTVLAANGTLIQAVALRDLGTADNPKITLAGPLYRVYVAL